MGFWSIGILDNDSACNIYDIYKQEIENGVAPSEYAKEYLDKDRIHVYDDDTYIDSDGHEILALALVMWETNTLTSEVYERAKSIIENGDYLEYQLKCEMDPEDVNYMKIILDKFLILLSKKPEDAPDYSKLLNIKYEDGEEEAIKNMFT